MPVNTLKELLRLRLGETYGGEQEMLQLVDAIETETHSRLLRDRLRGHRDEARRHINALEKSFELLGTDPPRSTSPALHGLCEERRGFVREAPGPVALESYHVDLLNRASHYKVAAYEGVLDLAREIRQGDVVSLLDRCLKDESAATDWLRDQRSAVVSEVRPAPNERALAAPQA
jgi:ferritin-like metal-binding protein YciE